MSIAEQEDREDAVSVTEPPQGQSLADRMAQRADSIQKQRAEWFPIPHWEDMLEVELRAIGFGASAKIVTRHERIRDKTVQKLYITADTLIAATLGFREVLPDGKRRELPNDSWASLAQRLPTCPDAPTARQAFLFLIPQDRILSLSSDYQLWADAQTEESEQEVAADFVVTG